MKNFYYSFTQQGILIVWHTAPDEKPELLTIAEPAIDQTGVMHTQGRGMVSIKPAKANEVGVPAIIECLLYYQQYYSQN